MIAGEVHRLLGETALRDDPAQAAYHFEKSISILEEINAVTHLGLAYANYGRLHKQQGNIEQAREHLTNALRIFEQFGVMNEPETVREELADLPEV